jgi:transposase
MPVCRHRLWSMTNPCDCLREDLVCRISISFLTQSRIAEIAVVLTRPIQGTPLPMDFEIRLINGAGGCYLPLSLDPHVGCEQRSTSLFPVANGLMRESKARDRSSSFRHMSAQLRVVTSGSAPTPPEEMPSQMRRSNRYARYEAVQTLHQQALSQREIARRLKMSRRTVHRFLQAKTFPERSRASYRGSILDPYKPYLLDRWKAGCWNGTQLYSEVKQLGYTGSEVLCRRFITSLRKQHQAAGTASGLELSTDGAKVSDPANSNLVPSPKRRMSPARASWLCVCQPEKLDEKQAQQVEQLRTAHRDLDIAYQLSQAFVLILAEHRDQGLDEWLIQAKQSGIAELKSFAQGLRRDYTAVRAAFTSKWSNGQVEAQVNCLKLQKRLMFDRANFDLLRLHVLRRA